MLQSTILSSPGTGLFLGPAPCVLEYDVGFSLDWSVSGPCTLCFRVRCWFFFGLVCFRASTPSFRVRSGFRISLDWYVSGPAPGLSEYDAGFSLDWSVSGPAPGLSEYDAGFSLDWYVSGPAPGLSEYDAGFSLDWSVSGPAPLGWWCLRHGASARSGPYVA